VPDVYQFFPIVEDNNASRILSQSANLDDWDFFVLTWLVRLSMNFLWQVNFLMGAFSIHWKAQVVL
jgi:hypothetical protein